jgi:hypothetical protein
MLDNRYQNVNADSNPDLRLHRILGCAEQDWFESQPNQNLRHPESPRF